jgi:hypothetical protein
MSPATRHIVITATRRLAWRLISRPAAVSTSAYLMGPTLTTDRPKRTMTSSVTSGLAELVNGGHEHGL